MSIVTRTHIACDNCGIAYGVDMHHLKGTVLRKMYKSDGWIYSDNKDFCSECRVKTKSGNYIKTRRKKK